MKNTKNLFNINYTTYFVILTFFLTGLIKNILLIYLIVIFHELGHIFIITKLKYSIKRVDIYPMGGITTIKKDINTPLNHEFLIAIFGLVFQIILYLIFSLIFNLNFITLNTYNLFQTYNKTIFIFNLLPIIPLDGHIILRTLMEYFFPYKKSYYLSFFISIIFIIFFLTYNHLYSLNNYLIISFLIFKTITSFKTFKYQNLRFRLERHLNSYPYGKIKYETKKDLNLLKKDTYHYFKTKDSYVSEKALLKKKFFN